MRPARLINHQLTYHKYELDHRFFKKTVQTAIDKPINIRKKRNKKFYLKKKYIALHSYSEFFPRFSSIGRSKNICFLTSKPRSVFSKFKIARIALRELSHNIKIQGLQRANW